MLKNLYRMYIDMFWMKKEHIAPQTENEKPASGYGRFTEKFKERCIDCLGNYLLLLAPNHESIGNKPFVTKRNSYTQLAQKIEIQ